MLKEITDKNSWDKHLAAATLRSGGFLQSWQWGEFQRGLGRKIHRFASEAGFALVFELPLPFGRKYWMSPKGPVIIGDKGQAPSEIVDGLKKEAKKAGAVFLRIEPEASVPRGAVPVKGVNPQATSIVNLSPSEEGIMSAMHHKTRYNIKVSEKHGVLVDRWVASDGEKFEELMALFGATAARDGFRLHPREYYSAQLASFRDSEPKMEVFSANFGGKMLAAAVVVFDSSTATYLHGASSNEMRNLMAPYALHWAIVKAAKERGCTSYDLWGISDDPKSGWAGITRFKRGWGGVDFSAAGTWDLPLSGFWYSLYKFAKRLRKLA
jgi:peptidoglycan pentaglycine glycine transferase (the first glycine)